MTTITFLRARPAETVNQLIATTRRKEGTTALEIPAITAAAVSEGLAGGCGRSWGGKAGGPPRDLGFGTSHAGAWLPRVDTRPLLAVARRRWRR